MKMHDRSQTRLGGNSCILLQHLFIQKPAITVLKVVVCERCVRQNKLPLWRPGAILAIFLEKNSHFNAIWKIF